VQGLWKVGDHDLLRLWERARRVICRRNPRVNLTWVPRQQNRTGEVLERDQMATIYIYATGNVNGGSARTAWIKDGSKREHKKAYPEKFTDQQALFRAFDDAVSEVEDRDLLICTDSELLYRQFNGRRGVKDRCLNGFLESIDQVKRERCLSVKVSYIPRWENQARTHIPSTPTLPKSGKKT
jgi:ribonuclease HI